MSFPPSLDENRHRYLPASREIETSYGLFRSTWVLLQPINAVERSAGASGGADDPGTYFTIPHFDGYPAILVHLGNIPEDELEELLAQAWLCRAPKRLASQFLTTRQA
jgi:hypothetical protein